MANVKITTGQYVSIEQHTASVIDRVYAQLLDWLFLWIYASIVSAIIFTIVLSHPYKSSPMTEKVEIIVYVTLMLPFIFYHLIFEFFFNGASPGKKIMKLRVVHVDGSSPTLGSFVMRWMMQLLECILFPAVGLLCIIFSKKGQRLGDMMAGTMVIKRDYYSRNLISLNNFGYVNPDYKPYYPEVATLSTRQAEVVQETLMINNINRDYYINMLSAKIIETLNIPPLVGGNNETFLNTVLNDYRYYCSTIEI